MKFRFAIARGIWMIVTASAIAVTTCSIASHQPAKMIHTMLHIGTSGTPWPLHRRCAERPAGAVGDPEEAFPTVMVMMSTQQITPAMT